MLYKDFLKTVSDCPFCDHYNRVILDSGFCFLTYALAPYHKHHLLIIPKRHVESISELSKDEEASISSLEQKAAEILKNIGHESVSILVREGNDKNKSVNHVHFHVIPDIRIGDMDHYGQERRIMTDSEITETVEEILEKLHQ
jgi:histidine triad (HIT) family protein